MNKMVTGLICCLFLTTHSFASVKDELYRIIDQVNSSANVDAPEVYKGQRAGYATGGGITVRNRLTNAQLMGITMPHFDAGCGGIDMHTGGFSFISDEQFVNTLKSVASSAAGYAFLLGLETVSPQIVNNIKQLQTWANEATSQSINSCELGSLLTGAVWPQHTQASQQICRTIGTEKGIFRDFVNARHNCAQQGQYDSVAQARAEDPQYQHLLVDDYNVAWEALNKVRFGAHDQETKELMMSLLGTVIFSSSREREPEIKRSRINDESFLRVLLEGGSTQAYYCKDNDQKCLVIGEKSVTIQPSDSMVGKIRNQLLSITRKIRTEEEPLTQAEINLITSSSLPLYKAVNVLAAYKKGNCPVDLYNTAEIVAMDTLLQYLREVINIVREGAQQVRREQMYADKIDEYLAELDRLERTVRYYEARHMRKAEEEYQFTRRIELAEQQLFSEFRLY